MNYAFELYHPYDAKLFLVAEDRKTYEEWFTALQAAIENSTSTLEVLIVAH